MHQDEAGAPLGAQAAQRGIEPETGDVVDDRGTSVERGAGDHRLGSVYRDEDAHRWHRLGRSVKSFHDSFNHRHDSSELLLHRHGRRAGAGGFSSHVENRGAVPEQLLCAPEGRVDGGVPPAIAERIGGDVEDADQHRPVERHHAAGGLPEQGLVARKRMTQRGGELHQRFRRSPRPSQGREPRPRPGEQGPVLTGDDVESEAPAGRHQRLECGAVELGQVIGERLEAGRGGPRQIALPSMGQEGVSDGVLGTAGERNEPHAPDGCSAGGMPISGGRIGPVGPGLGA